MWNGEAPNDIQFWVYTDRKMDKIRENDTVDVIDLSNMEDYEVWRCPECKRLYVFGNTSNVPSYIYRLETERNMKETRPKNWFLISVVLTAVLLASLLANVTLYGKNAALTDDAVRCLQQDWQGVSQMVKLVDSYVTDSDVPSFDGIKRCSLLVNQTCYNNFTSGHISEISSEMRNWLALSYDSVFQDLLEDEPVDADLALQIIRDMNRDLRLISAMVLETDKEVKEWLYDQNSIEYKEFLAMVKAASLKYTEECDSYFRNGGSADLYAKRTDNT